MAKIAIDADGVLADFNDAFTDAVNELWPKRIERGYEPVDWNYGGRLNEKELDKVWEFIRGIPNFWLTLRPYHLNVAQLAGFMHTTRDHDVYIVTSRVQTKGFTVAKQTSMWLHSCGVFELHNYLAVFPVENSNYKHKIYDYADIEYSVDDKKETVELCDKLENHKAFLLDRPWNQDANVKRRIKSLKEFFDAIQA